MVSSLIKVPLQKPYSIFSKIAFKSIIINIICLKKFIFFFSVSRESAASGHLQIISMNVNYHENIAQSLIMNFVLNIHTKLYSKQ